MMNYYTEMYLHIHTFLVMQKITRLFPIVVIYSTDAIAINITVYASLHVSFVRYILKLNGQLIIHGFCRRSKKVYLIEEMQGFFFVVCVVFFLMSNATLNIFFCSE